MKMMTLLQLHKNSNDGGKTNMVLIKKMKLIK